MNIDLELAQWRADYKSYEAPDNALGRLDLRRLVDRKRRKMVLALVSELVCGVALLMFSAWFVSTQPTVEWAVWAAVIWVTTFFAAGFTVWNRIGVWKTLQESNSAFLALSRRRCQRELRAIRVGRWFLVMQLAIVSGWLSWALGTHRLALRAYVLGIAMMVALSALYLGWFRSRERRSANDLRRLDEFED